MADGVASITLNAAERRNAFTPEMVGELIAACDEIDRAESVGAVVIKANGDSFCSGAHRSVLAAAGRDPAADANYRALGVMYNGFVRVGALLPPTVAAVRGHCVGAGVNLMLATDVRVMAVGARVITGFLRIGIHPGGGHFTLLGRLAGREAAAAMSLFGEEIDGRRAEEIGLAWSALPADEVEPKAMELARRVAKDPDLARAAARSLRLELGPPSIPWPAALEAEKAVQMWSLRRQSGDVKAGSAQ
ncbi:MAG TPA: enoyl-CoA hydratase/isomerase family protein [Candidatus Acidoferrum sp.]|nr:enoyl-CoA hydratase/isomerase family protein [Candidatus Acidoferrum sp.]